MAFSLTVDNSVDVCDKCKKSGSAQRLLVCISLTGRHTDQRAFIQIHEDCLLKAIKKAKNELAGEPTDG